MRQVNPIIYFVGAVAMSAALLSGCSRAQSQTTASNKETNRISSTPSTNSVMAPFQKPTADDLKKKLTPMQFDVTQHAGTEPAFRNEFWNNHKPGLYVDIVSGQALFSSLDKFDSGCGWPRFSRPLAEDEVVEHTDHSLFMERTEVRSK